MSILRIPPAVSALISEQAAEIDRLNRGQTRIWNEAIEAAAVIADDEDDAISLYVEDRNTRIAQKTCAIVAKCIRALKKGGE